MAHAGGRPTVYKKEFEELAYKLSLLGLTDKQMASIFNVKEQTLNSWKKIYPKFFESLKKGKDIADAEVVHSLYKRAYGYSHKAVKFFQAGQKIISQEYIEHYPPDPTSMIFWLKNRQPKKFRDKQEFVGDALTPQKVIVQIINSNGKNGNGKSNGKRHAKVTGKQRIPA